jgi:16S rRNA (guanine527-N7)-methyltransferase
MTEEEARGWAMARFDEGVIRRLDQLAGIVERESQQQNLIAHSTLPLIWSRHIVDSLQLIRYAPERGIWLDVGTGAGFPGLVVAVAEPEREIILVEPRRLRAEYLQAAARGLSLPRVTVALAKVETVAAKAAVISARAVSRIGSLIASAAHCAEKDCIWLLPKGRNAHEEVADARQKWHGVFHVEHSITDPDSSIVVARGVRAR